MTCKIMTEWLKFWLLPILSAILFLIVVNSARAVVATTAVPCITTGWTDLGAGPMTIESTTGCKVSISDSDPGGSGIGFNMGIQEPFVYSGTSHLWVKGTGIATVGK
jgi:hypothetical protein